MLELYIANRKADIPENFNVLFNYNSTEVSNPTAIKNKYSSTITLPGTPNNNEIFGNIWNLGRILIPQEQDLRGPYDIGRILSSVHFDPRKRVDFKIYNNSDLIESGYLQLLEINYTLPEITYRLSLYGGIGDFFYTLQYDQDNIEKNLGSLYWGWSSTLDLENVVSFDLWNRNFIKDTWDNLGTTPTSPDIKKDITAIPSYSGQYEDFSADKVLVNVPSLSGYYSQYQTVFPSQISDGGQTYSLYNGKYALVETPRELSEYEARDLRSTYQRIGLRFSSFFRAISDPINNGGYEVVLDPEIKDTPYFKKSWILLDRPKFETDEDAEDTNKLYSVSGDLDLEDGDTGITGNFQNDTQLQIFDNSSYSSPGIKINLSLLLDYVSPFPTDILNYGGVYQDGQTITWDHIGARIEMFDPYNPSTILGASRVFLFVPRDSRNATSNVGYFPSLGWLRHDVFLQGQTSICNAVNATFGGNSPDIYPELYDRIFDSSWSDAAGEHYSFKTKHRFNSAYSEDTFDLEWKGMPVSSLFGLRLRFFKIRTVGTTSGDPGNYNASWTLNSTIGDYRQWYNNDPGLSATAVYDQNSKVYATDSLFKILNAFIIDSDKPGALSANAITKDILFSRTENPLKYLLDWTKMFDLRFRLDQHKKIVYIDKRNNYYLDETLDLKVDLKKNIKIDPTVAKYKTFSYGLPVADTYASQLYMKRTTEEYGKVKLNTGYEFNNETRDLYEDSVYKALIPYAMNSYYFSHQGTNDLPSCVLSPSYDYSLYNGSDNKTTTLTSSWTYIASTYSKDYLDPLPKLCIFSEDENYLDSVNSIVFYNGTYNNSEIQLSDNLGAMLDLNESSCYLLSRDSSEVLIPAKIPYFFNSYIDPSAPDTYSHSFNFAAPVKEFKDSELYYDYRAPIYYNFWTHYAEDLYNPNGKTIQVYAFVEGRPEDMMRKFWRFQNATWVITEIKNYNITDSNVPVSMILAKVEDPTNYLIHY